MRTSRLGIAVLAAAAALLAACGDQEGSDSSGGQGQAGADRAAASPSPPEDKASPGSAGRSPREKGRQSTPGTVVTTGDSEFGTMLFDRVGQAIYLFEKETTSRPDCYGACAKAWPPVLSEGQPRAAGQVRKELLGTTKRRDGSTQVTYRGHPLYYYAHEGRNEVLCHNVSEFGALWLVVKPDGNPAA